MSAHEQELVRQQNPDEALRLLQEGQRSTLERAAPGLEQDHTQQLAERPLEGDTQASPAGGSAGGNTDTTAGTTSEPASVTASAEGDAAASTVQIAVTTPAITGSTTASSTGSTTASGTGSTTASTGWSGARAAPVKPPARREEVRPWRPPPLGNVIEIFMTLTQQTCPDGQEEARFGEGLRKLGFQADQHGNYRLDLPGPGGQPSTVGFCAHLDDVSTGVYAVEQLLDGHVMKTDGSSILGADCKAGMSVLLHMLGAGVPGRYLLFVGEEKGLTGSGKAADSGAGEGLKQLVAFDRKGASSVVTHQRKVRTCSQQYAGALAEALAQVGLEGMSPDDGGSLTDSFSFAQQVPACTNLSVGYQGAHSCGESQDLAHLVRLAEACCRIDWEALPIGERDMKVPTRAELTRYSGYAYSYDEYDYAYGRDIAAYQGMHSNQGRWQGSWDDDEPGLPPGYLAGPWDEEDGRDYSSWSEKDLRSARRDAQTSNAWARADEVLGGPAQTSSGKKDRLSLRARKILQTILREGGRHPLALIEDLCNLEPAGAAQLLLELHRQDRVMVEELLAMRLEEPRGCASAEMMLKAVQSGLDPYQWALQLCRDDASRFAWMIDQMTLDSSFDEAVKDLLVEVKSASSLTGCRRLLRTLEEGEDPSPAQLSRFVSDIPSSGLLIHLMATRGNFRQVLSRARGIVDPRWRALFNQDRYAAARLVRELPLQAERITTSMLREEPGMAMRLLRLIDDEA